MIESRLPAPANLILYGPPGTGKTYHTAFEAVRLCDGTAPGARSELMKRYRELVEAGRIAFVTFHQSYAYEDFVEGLRPVAGGEGEGDSETSGFSLRVHDGVFKQIANVARNNRGRPRANATSSFDESMFDGSRKAFKVSLGRSNAAADDWIFESAIAGGYVVLSWGGDVDWSDPRYGDFAEIKNRWREVDSRATGNDPNISQIFALRSNMRVGSLVVVSDGNRKFRAVGEVTGPYYFEAGPDGNHRRKVRWLWHSEQSLPRERIYGRLFSQISVYELNENLINWKSLAQIVRGSGEASAVEGDPEPYVLIIDEINRANISKVFGELITLIEPDKRAGMENALQVILPYSQELFVVPANLHIVGTMNTADRSIALLDTALRRRFSFRELMPNAGVLADRSIDGINLGDILTRLNDRIEFLFDRDHQIGHAYFMDCARREDLDTAIREKVIPLLVEYFYENWEKVRIVLGEREDDGAFVQRSRLGTPANLEVEDDDNERWRYNVKGEFAANAYAQLLR